MDSEIEIAMKKKRVNSDANLIAIDREKLCRLKFFLRKKAPTALIFGHFEFFLFSL